MNYRLAYSVGFHPWEDAAHDPPFAEKISEMFDREERGREPPYGTALDIGTGSGIWGIELAKRGCFSMKQPERFYAGTSSRMWASDPPSHRTTLSARRRKPNYSSRQPV